MSWGSRNAFQEQDGFVSVALSGKHLCGNNHHGCKYQSQHHSEQLIVHLRAIQRSNQSINATPMVLFPGSLIYAR
jgi:hypothetical protein